MPEQVNLAGTLLNILGVVVPQARIASVIARGGTVMDVLSEAFPTIGAFASIRGQLTNVAVARVGVPGLLMVKLAEENLRLRLEVQTLQDLVAHSRPAKRRSPADWRFRVLRWEQRTMEIRPRELSGEKIVPSLRLWVPLEDKKDGAPYWDITGGRLISTLLPLLQGVQASGAYLHLVKYSEGPGATTEVIIEPP